MSDPIYFTKVSTGKDRKDHFHLNLRPPARLKIGGGGGNLLSDQIANNLIDSNTLPSIFETESLNTIDFINGFLAQGLVTDVTENEEGTMITMDVPVQLAQNSVEIIQKANPLKKLPRFDYLIKTCQVAKGDTTKSYAEAKNWNESHSKLEGNNSYTFDRMNHVQDYLFPKSDIYNPLILTGEYKNGDDKIIGESIKILQLPKHGKLIINEEVRSKLNVGDFGYIANLNFEGDDKVVFSAKYHGKNYKVVMNLRVRYGYISDSSEGIELASALCANSYKYIKLSDATSYINTDNTYYMSLFAGYNSPQITFANLTGAAVGETTGEGVNATITLDTDAAGHGWYIGGLSTEDGGQNLSTPSSIFNPLSSVFSPPSSDWLPTSNPNEWVAKAGTAAEAKMDMLSVLLHEYGHALGIEHSNDAHDYMGTTLTAGMRRLPNSDEMQLMAQLAAEAREAILAGQGYTLTVANSQSVETQSQNGSRIEYGAGSNIEYGMTGESGLVSGSEQDTPLPTLPINMGFGISFVCG